MHSKFSLPAQSMRRHSIIALATLLSVLATPTTWAYDGFGGYFSYIVSPQICRAQYANHEQYIVRSGNAQIRNKRDSSIKLVCPLHRTHQSDRNGECDSEFSLQMRIRLQPAKSGASARIRLSFADDEQGTTPAAFKTDGVISIANSRWDGSSTYTNSQYVEVVMDCIQKDNGGNDVDLDTARWVPSASISLPPGAMVRRIQFKGGQNAP